MISPPPRGLPPRITVPIVLLAAVAVIGIVGYFLRIGLGVTGAALGPQATQGTSGATQRSTVPPVATRAPGEVTVPQSGGIPTSGSNALPGNPVGGGGPAPRAPAPTASAGTGKPTP
jgi:hypothetical protein